MSLHHNHHFLLHKALHDKMNLLYIYQAFLTFAKSMIGIFVPVYLYKIGYSIVEVLLYSIGYSLVFLIMIPMIVKVIQQIGFKYSLLLSTPIYLSHLISLNYLSQSTLFFHLAWLTFGFYLSMFWLVFHSEVAVNGSTKHRSSQIGTLQILSTIFGTAAPLIGGIFLDYSSYWYLLLFASSVILLGTIPLLFSKDISVKNYDFNYKDYYRIIKSQKNKISKKSFAYEGLDALLMLKIWPLIVFILLSESFFNLGFLLTVISFFNLIVILYLKSYFDKKGRDHFISKIAKIKSAGWFLKSIAIFFSLIFLYFVELISKLSQQIFNMLFMSIFYNNAKKQNFMDYIILRELYLHVAKILFTISVIFILIAFGQNLFILSSVAFSGVFISFGLGYLREEK